MTGQLVCGSWLQATAWGGRRRRRRPYSKRSPQGLGSTPLLRNTRSSRSAKGVSIWTGRKGGAPPRGYRRKSWWYGDRPILQPTNPRSKKEVNCAGTGHHPGSRGRASAGGVQRKGSDAGWRPVIDSPHARSVRPLPSEHGHHSADLAAQPARGDAGTRERRLAEGNRHPSWWRAPARLGSPGFSFHDTATT